MVAKAQAPPAKTTAVAEKPHRSAQGPKKALINPVWAGLAVSIQSKLDKLQLADIKASLEGIDELILLETL